MVADVAESGDRPATECEIEITPEMVEAGVIEVCSFDPRFEDSMEYTVECVFRAMLKAYSHGI